MTRRCADVETPIYLDYAATTPVDPRVAEVAFAAMTEEFGNAGSRTHLYGSRAKSLVDNARQQVAAALGCRPPEVIFTSGATEADNLSILGLAERAMREGHTHLIATAIEHKAVLEPLEHLATQGFEVTLLHPDERGWVEADQVASALRPNTALVSVMHVNNETGVIQPIDEIADVLADHSAAFHVDAAQGFLKDSQITGLDRIDLLSLSGHKILGPKGVGALVVRSRGHDSPPIEPLMFGGGQERGIRPGTIPVHLIAALGLAAELGASEREARRNDALRFRDDLKAAFAPLKPRYLGDQSLCVPNIVSLALEGIDSEAFMLMTKEHLAISNGSACTSHRYEPSHVLSAMGFDEVIRQSAVRISWGPDCGTPDWDNVVSKLKQLL